MNPEEIFQTVQKGFRVTLGATSTLIESIQNPQQRDEALNKLRTNPTQLAEELAAKGEVTEQEARNFVDTLFSSQQGTTAQSSGAASGSAAGGPVAPPDIENDLKDLTAEIAAMRAELEKLRQQDS